MKLSDAYEKKLDNPELELTVTVYNINYGYNEEIMNACRMLKEYAMYVEQVRIYAKQMPLTEAVEMTVNECIGAGILSDFLRQNRAEAIKMSIYEYDEELHFRTLLEEGRELRENLLSRVNQLTSMLIDLDRIDDLKRATQDRTYQEQLMEELLPEDGQDT